MLRRLIEVRMLIALAIAAGVGIGGLRAFPIGSDQVFLAVIEARHPGVSTRSSMDMPRSGSPRRSWIASMIASLVHDRRLPDAPRPRGSADCQPYPKPETRPAPSLVLGEAHHATRPGRAPEPTWLTIPQRGLYTGVMILGAVGHRKTSAACIRTWTSSFGGGATMPTARSAGW